MQTGIARRRRRRICWRSGAAITEMAIILPILVLIMASSLDFGLILFKRQHMILAAREGVRVRAVEGPTSAGSLALAATQSYLTDIYPALSGDFTVTVSPQGAATSWVRVRLPHSAGGAIGFLSGENNVVVEMHPLTANP
jgi:Flp pilus assembly protein TadG